MSSSLWHNRAAPLPSESDCVVIGAGIAGASAALAFEAMGMDTLLLEQRYPGWGATGRNAGYLMRGAADNYAAAIRDLGRDSARALWKLTEDNLTRLRSLGLESLVHYRQQPSCLIAFDAAEAAELERSASQLSEDGFAVETQTVQDKSQDAVWRNSPPHIGLINPNDAVCDPVELLSWLCSMLRRPPLPETSVQQIERHDDGFSILTSRGVTRCEHVLICTNAYTRHLLPNLGAAVEPNRGQMLALDASTLPPSDRLQFAYYANHGSEYFRQLDDSTIIVGGWRKHFASDERTTNNSPSAEVQQGLEDFAARVLGHRLPVLHRWAGTMAFTPDGLPLAGPTTANHDRTPWICAGFTGHGMSMAHELATTTAQTMAGKAKIPTIFRPDRFKPA